MRLRWFNSISAMALGLSVLLLALSAAVRAQDMEPDALLHSFSGSDGSGPYCGLMQGTNGDLYGTTFGAGAKGGGTVFKIKADGSGFTLLHSFNINDPTNGAEPEAGLILGKDGYLYGTTFVGGAFTSSDPNGLGFGTVFKMKPDGSGYTLLHSFNISDTNGANPTANLIQSRDGCLYGTTENGGAFTSRDPVDLGFGTVFKLKTDGSDFALLHSFSVSDGAYPTAGLVQGKDGYLYGTTDLGGAFTHGNDFGFGTVFKIKPDGSGFILHSFNDRDGGSAIGGVILGKDGALYGTTLNGGAHDQGTVFKLDPDGSGFTSLYSFNVSEGADPEAGLILGKDGYLYGTTTGGGPTGNGAVFKLKADGSYFTLLHYFGGFSSDGTYPNGLFQAEDGNIYGTNSGDGITQEGDIKGGGTIFRFGPVADSLDPKVLDVNVNTLLTLTGSGLASNDVVCWNSTQLATTFLSNTRLQVTVPANLVSSTGTAQITVWDPNISNTSNSLVAHIGAPELQLSAPSLIHENADGSVTVHLILANKGTAQASNVTLTSATLGGISASSGAGQVGTIDNGSSIHVLLHFPTGVSLGTVDLTVEGSYRGGSFSDSISTQVLAH